MKRIAVALFVSLALAAPLAAQGLRILNAGPNGEVATLAEANEIRVTFSEPMVNLGTIPTPVAAPFFKISPAIKGSFRWSDTTTLIFTPAAPLPYATKYDVTIDPSKKSIAGKALPEPYKFSFTTPTIRLQSTQWYRKGGNVANGVIIALRFNQPVNASTILGHLQLRTSRHVLGQPELPAASVERLQRLEPQAIQAFEQKRAKAYAQANSDGAPILAFAATDWDKQRFVPSPDLVVLETKPGIPPETSMQVVLDEKLAATPAQQTFGQPQSYTIELEPALFVSIYCTDSCNPDDRNPMHFSSREGIRYEQLQKALTVTDITDPAHEVVIKSKPEEREYDYPSSDYSVDELGYSLLPKHTYAIRIDPSLEGEDKQKLGYTYMAVVSHSHRSAFISFGDGHGVWESSGGPLLPFSARNYRSVKQWLVPVTIEEVMPLISKQQKNNFTLTPEGAPTDRKLEAPADKIKFYGLNLKPAIGDDNLGLAWAAVEPGKALDNAPIYDTNRRATIVQSTNLGISVKDSPYNTLIFVTTLDNATPVANAKVSIRTLDNNVFWSGETDANGIAIAPDTDLRRKTKEEKKEEGLDEDYDDSWSAANDFRFIVTAEKDGDVAYVSSDWTEGGTPWDFDFGFDINEADPLVRGTIFSDRGVYKLGEEIHLKLILRSDTPTGIQLFPAGTKVEVTIRDSYNKDADTRTLTLNAWSSAEWTWKVPDDSPLGNYSVLVDVKDARAPKKKGRYVYDRGEVSGSFLVAAYRRPEFRVDVAIAGTRKGSTLAGDKLNGTITGKYLFGGPMPDAPVSWTYSKRALFDVPSKILDRWPYERYSFLGYDPERSSSSVTIEENTDSLDDKGDLKLKLETEKTAGWPFEYKLEGVVTDVTRQEIAGRTAVRVDPAPWYIGIKTPPYFAESSTGVDTEVIAAGLDGLAVPGVDVKLSLKRIQWTSVRSAEGEGFYGWESEKKEIPAGEWKVTTKGEPAPLHIPLDSGGYYVLTAKATDKDGRFTTTNASFYALGAGYTAWERTDGNRIELVPEKQTYRPGDTARVMIKSPWEKATALVTTEREGVRTWKRFELTSTQQTIDVPIAEKDIPNVFVSVLLLKGRTKKDPGKDGSDPGKPAFRLGYVELKVEDATKRLKLDVKAGKDEFRPASKAKIEVDVRDASGKPSQSEVTLWAVDYGVLSLTAYQTPDVLDTIYLEKMLQVVNEDSRQKIVSRRVLTPKGAGEGGGGGRDAGPGMLRKDFRVLAFWLGSLTTDAKGHLSTEVKLPESLTTYRIMAVAGDKQSRFGWAQNEIKINKPLMLTPAFPRFLALGDKAFFGGVVRSQLKQKGTATVTIKSLNPDIVEFTGDKQTVDVPAGGSVEVRFDANAKAIGTARVQMRVVMGSENDGFEDTIPVRMFLSPETVAAYGEAKPRAEERLDLPKDVAPGFGGLRLDLSSTAMVGLNEGAQYLLSYPYGCAEQRGSAALALLLAADLGEAFNLQGIDPKNAKSIAQSTLDELKKFQCGSGGFTYWAGDCSFASPYLTSYLLHIFQRAQKLGYHVDKDMLDRAYTYLEQSLNEPKPANEGWVPAYTAWQSFATMVLATGGHNVDSHINRLYGYIDRMPLFGIAYLSDALIAKGERGPRLAELHRRMTNAILPEGGSAHVEELNDSYLQWFWNSNVRTTAIVMGTLVRHGESEDLVKKMVRWLMQVRKGGRWGNTQENAWAMESLIDFYRKYESEVPDFTAVVTFGTEQLAKETFKGRDTNAREKGIPMQTLLQSKQPSPVPVVFTREGTGTLYYMLRLRYARTLAKFEALDQGFHLERTYALQTGGAGSSTTFKAGDLILVTLKIRNTKERRYVAITDPVPAGTEPVEAWFATTAQALAEQQSNSDQGGTFWAWWERGGFDHIERHDDRVDLFATRLSEGNHEYTYLLRATTAGTFRTAPAHAEEMYEPEVFGRTASVVVEVRK
ncbi:MAG TPA: alpha-2-macroglobulin family protein [Thermoanaerobaculia bacterium]|nr:alpha-2-macroglobulin family protein [Thermoanaerobaculia bacterium]